MTDQHKTSQTNHPPVRDPQDLERLLVSRQNAGDADGMAALYEPQAVLDAGFFCRDGLPRASAPLLLHGREAIRQFFRELIASGRKFEMGEQQPALISGDLALTSTRCRNGTVTAEVARRQPDGTWLWALDKFSIS